MQAASEEQLSAPVAHSSGMSVRDLCATNQLATKPIADTVYPPSFTNQQCVGCSTVHILHLTCTQYVNPHGYIIIIAI